MQSATKSRPCLDRRTKFNRTAKRLKIGWRQFDNAAAYNNLGVDLKELGKLDEAMACFRRLVDLERNSAETHSNLVNTLMFCAGYDPQTLYDEQRRRDQAHAAPGRVHPAT